MIESKKFIQFSKPLEFYYLRTVGANLMEFGKTYFTFIKTIEIIISSPGILYGK